MKYYTLNHPFYMSIEANSAIAAIQRAHSYCYDHKADNPKRFLTHIEQEITVLSRQELAKLIRFAFYHFTNSMQYGRLPTYRELLNSVLEISDLLGCDVRCHPFLAGEINKINCTGEKLI